MKISVIIDELIALTSASRLDPTYSAHTRKEILKLLIGSKAQGEMELTTISDDAKLLFLPTGPLQELAIENGWGEKFLVLASQLDEALGER